MYQLLATAATVAFFIRYVAKKQPRKRSFGCPGFWSLRLPFGLSVTLRVD